MLLERGLGNTLSLLGQLNAQRTAVIGVGVPLDQFLARKTIQQSCHGAAGHACPFSVFGASP